MWNFLSSAFAKVSSQFLKSHICSYSSCTSVHFAVGKYLEQKRQSIFGCVLNFIPWLSNWWLFFNSAFSNIPSQKWHICSSVRWHLWPYADVNDLLQRKHLYWYLISSVWTSSLWSFLTFAFSSGFSQISHRCSDFTWSVFQYAVWKHWPQKWHLFLSIPWFWSLWSFLAPTFSKVSAHNSQICSQFSCFTLLLSVVKCLLQKRHLFLLHSNSWIILTSVFSNVFPQQLHVKCPYSSRYIFWWYWSLWSFLAPTFSKVSKHNSQICSQFSCFTLLLRVVKCLLQKRHLFPLLSNSWIILTSGFSNVFPQQLHVKCPYITWSIFRCTVTKYVPQKRHVFLSCSRFSWRVFADAVVKYLLQKEHLMFFSIRWNSALLSFTYAGLQIALGWITASDAPREQFNPEFLYQ